MQGEQILMRPKQMARLLGWGIRFFLAAGLTAVQLPGGSAPFALGCMAAAGPGGDGVAALLGTVLGSLLFQDFEAGLPHLATAVLILTASVALRDIRWFQRPAVPAVCVGVLTLTVGMIYVLQAVAPLRQLPVCVTAAVMAGVSARMYGPLLDGREPELQMTGMRFLAVTLLAAFAEAEPLSVTPSAAAVAGPTLPSASRPFLRWNHSTASRVFSP